jgi:hypothetical protein
MPHDDGKLLQLEHTLQERADLLAGRETLTPTREFVAPNQSFRPVAFQQIGCKYFGPAARQIEVKHQREGTEMSTGQPKTSASAALRSWCASVSYCGAGHRDW